ncbi:GIY-YIG nuclease family protein [Macrococcus carouselicus]|uniref:GIY-YIG nuclease family protein n=1 Tax=Macrococcus carouselicus TaxID=69969 RepID=A0A9Q8CJ42_9STAP|nr:GIY-YIG nuclease family protein [Macrococcus carouselicus]TDL95273.1 GIY-YIG nuclease family protein [Macrococcus carouselicus]
MAEHFIYILECADGTYYTGYTTDLDKRLAVHNTGRGAKYTRNRLPVRRIYEERLSTKREAMQREYAIKQLTRKQKERLIKGVRV